MSTYFVADENREYSDAEKKVLMAKLFPEQVAQYPDPHESKRFSEESMGSGDVAGPQPKGGWHDPELND